MRSSLGALLLAFAGSAIALSYNDRIRVHGFDPTDETDKLEAGDTRFLARVRIGSTDLRAIIREKRLLLKNDLAEVRCPNPVPGQPVLCQLRIVIMTQKLRNQITCPRLLRWERRGGQTAAWLPTDEPTRQFVANPNAYLRMEAAYQADCDSR